MYNRQSAHARNRVDAEARKMNIDVSGYTRKRVKAGMRIDQRVLLSQVLLEVNCGIYGR